MTRSSIPSKWGVSMRKSPHEEQPAYALSRVDSLGRLCFLFRTRTHTRIILRGTLTLSRMPTRFHTTTKEPIIPWT